MNDDTISRQLTIGAIEQHEIAVLGNGAWDEGIAYGYAAAHRHLVEIIKQLPSAEPQIIRCKDCKNWDTTWTNDFSPNYHYCPMVDGVHKEDWFCAYGERRTDG